MAALVLVAPLGGVAQAGQAGQSSAQPADPIGEAYAQFLMAHRYEDADNVDAAA